MCDFEIPPLERSDAAEVPQREVEPERVEAPTEARAIEVTEVTERQAGQRLDDATVEPREFVESEKSDFSQAESIQREFEAVTDNFGANPETGAPAEQPADLGSPSPSTGEQTGSGSTSSSQEGAEPGPEVGVRGGLAPARAEGSGTDALEDEDDADGPRAMAIDYGQPASLGETPLGNDELPSQDVGGLADYVRYGWVVPSKEAIDGAMAAEDAAAAMGISSDPAEIYDRATSQPGTVYTPSGPEEIGGYEGPEEIGVVESSTESDLGEEAEIPTEVPEEVSGAMPSDAGPADIARANLAEYEGHGPGPGGTTELGADELEGEPIAEDQQGGSMPQEQAEAVRAEEAAAASGQGPSNPEVIYETATGDVSVGTRVWIGVEGEDSSGLPGGPEEVGPEESGPPMTGAVATEEIIDIQPEEGTGTVDEAGGPEEIQGSTGVEGGEVIISPSDSSEFVFEDSTEGTSQGAEVVGGEVNMSPGDSSEFDFGGSTGSVDIGSEAGGTGAVINDSGQGGSWEEVGSEVVPESGPASSAAPDSEAASTVSSAETGAYDENGGSWEEVGSEVMPESGPASTAAPDSEAGSTISSPNTGSTDDTGMESSSGAVVGATDVSVGPNALYGGAEQGEGGAEEGGGDWWGFDEGGAGFIGSSEATGGGNDTGGEDTGGEDSGGEDIGGSEETGFGGWGGDSGSSGGSDSGATGGGSGDAGGGGDSGGSGGGGDDGGGDDGGDGGDEEEPAGDDEGGGGEEGMTVDGGSGEEPGRRGGSILGGSVPSGGSETEDAGREGPILGGGALGGGGGESGGSDVGGKESQPISGSVPLHPDSGGAKPIDPVRATAQVQQADKGTINAEQTTKTGGG